MRIAEAHGDVFHTVTIGSVLGFLELSRGNPAAAHGFLGPVVELADRWGLREPGAFPFLADEIEALIALGELPRARTLIETLEERGRALDRALALATAARCRGLLSAAFGDLPGALAALDEALEHHALLPQPFDLARTLLVRGQTQRRMKKKQPAREDLGRALTIFERLPAPFWAERARAAMSRIGGRPARPLELTPTERRVAALVSEGRTNKEVAEEVFLSVKTVEANLRRVYQKLGVRSRTELAHRAARTPRSMGEDPSDQR
jgi:DNA-binding CsgD family transcriptional regulator